MERKSEGIDFDVSALGVRDKDSCGAPGKLYGKLDILIFFIETRRDQTYQLQSVAWSLKEYHLYLSRPIDS